MYWLVRSSSRRGGYGINVVDGRENSYFSQLKVHFFRVHENLVQHPSNYIEIILDFCLKGKIVKSLYARVVGKLWEEVGHWTVSYTYHQTY